MKRKVLVLGAGKIGGAIVDLLHASGAYEITLADSNMAFLQQAGGKKAATRHVDVSDRAALTQVAKGHQAVISALPFFLNPGVAQVCADVGAHYFDLTEDVETTRAVREISKTSPVAFAPQCGLAPGFISIVANHLAQSFDSLREVHMRVGALPEFPANALKYNLTWSTDGLINEYCNPCEAIHEDKLVEVMPLEGLETFSLDGIDYECFNTSGGLGTLCETLAGKVRSLNYRTIRYPGHAAIMKALLNDLRLRDRRDLLKDILENSVPATLQDVVIVFVTVSGLKGGHLVQETYAHKIYAQTFGGRLLSGIQITTAASLCAVLDLLAEGRLPTKGFVRQEEIALADFLGNRFGRVYAADDAAAHAATRPHLVESAA